MSLVQDYHDAHIRRLNKWAATAQQLKVKKVAPPPPKPAFKIEPIPPPIIIPITETMEAAEPVVVTVVPGVFNNRRTLKRILREVAAKYTLTQNDIISPSRNAHLCAARFEYCYRAVVETTLSLPTIGRKIERDHSTVIHAVAKHCNNHSLPFPRGAQWRKWRKAVPNV